jgi:hypothetical protein
MASARPQVNPFYIEPAAQEWNGDYDWRHDEDDVEHEGLLDSSTNNNWDEDPNSAVVRRRNRRSAASSHRHQHSPNRFRFLVGFGLVFIVFLVVLTLLGDSSNATQGTLDKVVGDDDGDDPQQQVQQIVILGERVSGVPWLAKQLQGMYPNINVTTTLQREGIWFQGPPDKPIPRTLIFAVFRNPHDWVEQMRLHPRFMPAHMDANGLPLPWNFFVEEEWAIARPQSDQPPLANETCQLGFSAKQVISCRVMDTSNDQLNPVYELQDGGKPFENILALRAAKIKHIFHDIPQLFHDSLVTDPIAIRYETDNLHAYLKMIPLLNVLDKELDASFVASPAPAADRQNMTMEYIQWMNEHVDWEVETSLGYQALKEVGPP